jgi:hypothetical protein
MGIQKSFKNVASKIIQSKALVVGSLSAGFATASQAAITYDATTGFAGSLDTTAYNTAVPIVVGVIALVVATTIGIKVLKSGKSA